MTEGNARGVGRHDAAKGTSLQGQRPTGRAAARQAHCSPAYGGLLLGLGLGWLALGLRQGLVGRTQGLEW